MINTPDGENEFISSELKRKILMFKVFLSIFRMIKYMKEGTPCSE